MSAQLKRLLAVLMIPVGLALAGAVHAQQTNAPTEEPAPRAPSSDDGQGAGVVEGFTLTPAGKTAAGETRPTPFLINARGDYQFDTDIDGAGEFNVYRLLVGGGMKFPLGEKLGGAVGAIYDYAAYDFDDAAAFGGGEPWDDINTGRFFALLNYNIDEKWSVFGGGVAAVSAESGASLSSAWTGGGFIGGGYRASDKLSGRLGVIVVSELEDDVLVLPIFVLDWILNENWSIRAGSVDSGATDAAGVGVVYRFNERWSVEGRVAYVKNRFRLDDAGFAPDGVGQDQRVNGTILLTWKPQPTLEVSLLGGVAFAGELRVEDDDGDRLFKEDYDPAPFVGARVAWRF